MRAMPSGWFSTGFRIPLILPFFFVTFAVGAWAEGPSASLDAHVCAARAKGFIEGRLAFWQQRLNLADWKISMVISHARELKPATLGNIHWDAAKKTAVIRVLDVSDYPVSCREALPDVEMTLVHELVHLELSSLPRSQASRHEEELAVNRIADALLRLDRQNASLPAGADGNKRAAAPGSNGEASRSRSEGLAPTR
jgi:hypothetical protein